jgi:hypothetical protein
VYVRMWKSSTSSPLRCAFASFAIPSRSSNTRTRSSRVVDLVDLIEPEHELGGLLAGREQESPLHVVGPPELVSLLEGELPALTGSGPILDRGRMDSDVLVDLDLHRRVGALRRRPPRLHLDLRHVKRMPVHPSDKT